MSLLRWWQLRPYSVADRILHALASGHRYAVPIMQVYSVNAGSLYAELIRLEAEGMVVSSWDDGTPRRRAYALAPAFAAVVPRMPLLNPLWQPLTDLTQVCQQCHTRHATIEDSGDWYCQRCYVVRP